MTEEHVHDPELDQDPQEVLDSDYNEATDVDHDPEPKHEDEINFVHQPVEGALPVDDECEGLVIPCAEEDEITDEDDEEDEQ